MAFNIISHTLWQPGASSGTSGAINTVGADLIIVSINAGDTVTGVISVTDSAGNGWHQLSIINIPFTGWTQLFYAWNAITSSSHTFDANVSSGIFYPTATVVAYSGSDTGSDPFFGEVGNSTYGANLSQNISVNAVGDLVASSCANLAGGNTPIVTAGYTIEEGSPFVGGVAYAGFFADKLSAGSTTENLDWSNLGSQGTSVSIATFRQAGAAPTGGGPLIDNGELVNGGALVKGRLVN